MAYPKLPNYLQKKLDWIIQQINCIKEDNCDCKHELKSSNVSNREGVGPFTITDGVKRISAFQDHLLFADDPNDPGHTILFISQTFIDSIDTGGGTPVNLSNYYTKTGVNSKFYNGVSEALTELQSVNLISNVLYINYKGENGITQTVNVDLSGLATVDIHIEDVNYNESSNILTLTDNEGNEYTVDLSEFSIVNSTNANGVTTLVQEGVTKLIVSKVGQTGDYNDLLNKPDLSIYETTPKNEWLKIGTVEVNDEVGEVTINVDSSGENRWKINNVEYFKTTETSLLISPVTEYFRIDAIVGNTDNTFEIVQGVESESPNEPVIINPNQLFLTTVLVTPDGLFAEQPTINLSGYRLKSIDGWINLTVSGSQVVYPTISNLKLGRFRIRSTASVVQLGGIYVAQSSNLYSGFPITIKNETAEEIEFIEGDAATNRYLFKPTDLPFSLPVGQSVDLAYDAQTQTWDVLKNGGSAEFPDGANGDVLAFEGGNWIASNRLTTAETDIADEQNTRSSVANLFLHFWDSTAGKWISSGVEYVSSQIIKLKSVVFINNTNSYQANEFGTDGTSLFFGSAKKKVAFDIQEYKTISADVTLDDSYHNCIVRITATCIITVPSTLRADFNAVFEVEGAFTATYTEGSGVTFSAPFGKAQTQDFMGFLRKTGSTTFRLRV